MMRHQAIRIEDDLGRLTRSIDFVPVPEPIGAHDTRGGGGVRDLWDVTPRLQLDLDLRLDMYQGESGVTPSPRIGLRYALDDDSRTTLKASAGRFVGRPPLGAQAFGQFPSRLDRSFVAATGALFAPSTPTGCAARTLELPRSDGVALEIEHRIRPGLEAQAAVRVRKSTDLPTVMVGSEGGDAVLASAGDSVYRELQISVRQVWSADAQLFVSYVHAMTQRRVERLRVDVHEPRHAAARAERRGVARHRRRAAPAARRGRRSRCRTAW